MPKTPQVMLSNSRGRVTIHVFTRLQEWNVELRMMLGCEGTDGLYAMFRCQETGAERVFGCVRNTLTKGELEALFGPLDAHLRARGDARKAA